MERCSLAFTRGRELCEALFWSIPHKAEKIVFLFLQDAKKAAIMEASNDKEDDISSL